MALQNQGGKLSMEETRVSPRRKKTGAHYDEGYEGWDLESSRNHDVICRALKLWWNKELREEGYENVKGRINLGRIRDAFPKGKKISLHPDLDVIVGTKKDDKIHLIGSEVILFKGTEHVYEEPSGQEARQMDSFIHWIDQNVYSGIGKAVHLLRYVHQAYLAMPSSCEMVEECIINILPIGIIYFFPKNGKTGELQFDFKIGKKPREEKHSICEGEGRDDFEWKVRSNQLGTDWLLKAIWEELE